VDAARRRVEDRDLEALHLLRQALVSAGVIASPCDDRASGCFSRCGQCCMLKRELAEERASEIDR
jgi:hypothetical protein